MTRRNRRTAECGQMLLFATPSEQAKPKFAPTVLHGFAREAADELLAALAQIVAQSPFCRMRTPGGLAMSVAMTNCGSVGWGADRQGYRYTRADAARGAP